MKKLQNFWQPFRRHFKQAAQLGLFGLITVTLLACSKNSETQSNAVHELRYQSLTGVVSLPELAEDLGYLGDLKLKYVGSVQGGPQDLQALSTGDVDVATAFDGAIIKLAAAGIKIKAVVASYGSDDKSWVGYYVQDNSPIRSARDLIGKKVAVNTLGAHYEFVLKDYLARQGLSDDEIKQVEFVVLPPANTEQALRAGQIDAAALVSIFQDKALERGGLRKLVSDTDLYGSFTAGSYVFTEKFIQQHPEVVKQYVTGVAKAIEWSKQTPREQVLARFKSIIEKRKRNESDVLMQYWHSYGVVSQGGLLNAAQYQRWIDLFVKQGQLKPNQINADSLFTNQFNPYANENHAATNQQN
ncbi:MULTISPECIES: ABC transporter substrate-binding protein [unclassified Acinetobacter]|uniref:ABC transporter substrate-binding protein n=1 Tax=unclassified Acinetobacter TaxID=196816 RepID=UPI00244CCE2D|nr:MULTISPECIES: ABC transporter substrate-binding protein [unclassified Acinetobacter]MDH0030155.1 ABC transporter substrate-binding protein [Acinetobacter sp. GD04021]MDH0885013.1 ABC transporter substrate-binding protein [Acinetobacter sp. GD03873]MDH1082343.1 ABC transporter substrate-binding protein [Acinetobacter sp. GD03983]MDH2188546.1 ABC transporter substrate-binding protein [Acinetobacter sp. GD03645]MDH2201931.1 ABC transporter substrate-binding protein [Acinetobacter sp. GD03647]